MTIAVIDFETTGVDDTVYPIELAVVFLDPAHDLIVNGPTRLFNPGIHIPETASAVHHIIDEDVRHADPLSTLGVWWGVATTAMSKVDVLAAHNAAFDRRFVPPGETRPWICTYKCAMTVWPQAPAYGNQVLRYWLGLRPNLESVGQPHRALYDAIVTASLLQALLVYRTVNELIDITANPVLLPRVAFGKHKDQTWDTVPKGYLQWLLGQPGFDENVVHTARHWLAQ